MRERALLRVALLGAMMALAAACGDTPTPTPTPTPTTPVPITLTPPPPCVGTALAINVEGDAIAFDKDRCEATAETEVVMAFNNGSLFSQHNWVLVRDGTKDAVAARGLKAGPDKDWIQPGDPDVIAHTKLLDPGEQGEVRFTAPEPGSYQFICTFPGHTAAMFGDFVIPAATSSPRGTPSATYGYKSLTDDLARVGSTVKEPSGATVTLGGFKPGSPLSRVVLLAGGRRVAVDGRTIHVYEFPDDLAADTEARYVSSDGYNISVPLGGNRSMTSHREWIAPTHYFKKGRVIVLYVGHDASLVHLLRGALGPEFAGSFTITGKYLS